MNVVIVGAGDIGFHLSKRLSTEKHNITLIDLDPDKVRHAKEQLDAFVVQGSGCSYNTLESAQVRSAEVFAALSNNDEVNILACFFAKKMGVPNTIARVRNPEYTQEELLEHKDLGIDFVIHPEQQTASAIAQLVRQSSATDIVSFENGKIQLVGIRLDNNCPVLRIPLKDIGAKYGNPDHRIVALKRRQQTIVPRGDDMLIAGDQLFIICSNENLPDALSFFGKTDTKVENIMIIGGGLVGRFVAKQLEKEIKIKIIESDERKAEELADLLKHALVINGDGSDLDLLTFEGLDEMDEFIAVTGDDEANIITSLVAKHLEVPRTITMLRKMEYLPLTPAIGIDSIISKQQITVNALQKFIRSRQIASFAELPGVDAEIIEYIANERSKIVGKPLMKVKFPKNAIVGAVMRGNGDVVIPIGSTAIEAGDRVVVVSLIDTIEDVEKFFE